MTRCGIDRIADFSHILAGKRLGLVTGSSGIGRDYRSTIEILHEKYNLTTLFAPEHGVRGELQGGVQVNSHVDKHSGLPVYSLFSDECSIIDAKLLHNSLYMPSQEALDRVDAIVFDIQDVGSRYYTYPSTLFFVMKACAKAGKECIVLDRPNPIGGAIEGNSHREENFSFIGLTKVPIRHGMTLGELALFYNGEYHLGCKLHVIPADGWNRSMYFEDTGLPFVCPSPNLPNQNAIILYNGICMLAGTNVTDARGTTRPFEQFGAPSHIGRRVDMRQEADYGRTLLALRGRDGTHHVAVFVDRDILQSESLHLLDQKVQQIPLLGCRGERLAILVALRIDSDIFQETFFEFHIKYVFNGF